MTASRYTLVESRLWRYDTLSVRHEERRVIIHEFKQITENVWILPARDLSPNLGIITTPSQTILIDAGNSPREARRVMASLAVLDAPPVTYLIYTHHHWDHVFGAMVYTAPNVVSHQDCADILKIYANKLWNPATLREESFRDPTLAVRNNNIASTIEDWRNFRVVQPTMTFDTKLTLYLDGLTLELEHVGGRHAKDSIIIRLQEKRVLFIGDSYYPPPGHERVSNDATDIDERMVERLLHDDFSIYVDGHNRPMSADEFRQQLSG